MGAKGIASLTSREKQCLRLVYDRRKTKEIAIALGLREGTVFRYLNDAQRKLGAIDRREAAELLHAAEQAEVSTIESIPQSAWIEPVAPPAPEVTGGLLRTILGRLPLRQSGAAHNDLSKRERLVWIGAIILFGVAGFTVFASAARIVSDLFIQYR